MKCNKPVVMSLIASALAFGMMPVHAALPAAVTDAIATAQTDLTTLLTTLTAAGVAIWIVRVIYNKFRVK